MVKLQINQMRNMTMVNILLILCKKHDKQSKKRKILSEWNNKNKNSIRSKNKFRCNLKPKIQRLIVLLKGKISMIHRISRK